MRPILSFVCKYIRINAPPQLLGFLDWSFFSLFWIFVYTLFIQPENYYFLSCAAYNLFKEALLDHKYELDSPHMCPWDTL